MFSSVCSQLLVDTAMRTAATAVPADSGLRIQRQATDESILAMRVGEGGIGLEFEIIDIKHHGW